MKRNAILIFGLLFVIAGCAPGAKEQKIIAIGQPGSSLLTPAGDGSGDDGSAAIGPDGTPTPSPSPTPTPGSGGSTPTPTPTPKPTPTPTPSPTPKPSSTPTPSPTPSPTPYVPPPVGDGPDHLEFQLRDVQGKAWLNAPVSVAYVFKNSEVQAGQVSLLVVEDNKEIPVQVDILRKQENGSIRHALLSFVVPSLASFEKKTFRILKKAPLSTTFQTAYSPADLEARLELTGDSGTPNMSAALQEIVGGSAGCQASGAKAGDTAAWRFNGSIMKECVTWAKARHGDGTLDPQVDVSYRIRTYTGLNGARTEAVVENTHVKLAKSDAASAFKDHVFSVGKLTVGKSSPALVWNYGPLNLWAGTRFRVQKTYGAEMLAPEVIYNLYDLVQARVSNMLNPDLEVAYNYIDTNYLKGHESWVNPEPGDWANLPSYMGQAADHWYIGPVTDPDRIYLKTMNRRALQVSIGMHQAIDSLFEVSYRQSANPLSQLPGGTIGVPCQTSKDFLSGLKNAPGDWDVAHSPEVTMAYTFTGDLFLEESMLFIATNNLVMDSCTKYLQSRQLAWTIRTLTNATWIVSENNPTRAYLEQSLSNWFDVLKTKTIDTTFTDSLMEDTADGDVALQVSGRPYWVNSNRLSPWQYSWVCWSLQLASKKNYSKAPAIRDWVCPYTIESYTAEDEPEHNWVGPDGITYKFPSIWAMAYEHGHALFPTLKPYDPLYGGSCQVTPWQYMVPDPPKQRYVNRGQQWYYTMLNIVHQGYPFADLCPVNDNGTPATQWTLDNGWQDLGTASKWHEYGGEPGITAVNEAIISGSVTPTSMSAAKVSSAVAKNLAYRKLENSWNGLSFIAVPLLP